LQIWVGAGGPRMLRLIGRTADGWVIPLMRYMTPRQAAENSLIIDEGARAAGRHPSQIRRIYNCTGEFTESAPAPASDDDRKISGPIDHWIDVITHQVLDFGFSTFILFGPPDRNYLETFIQRVAPGVRERVSDRRGS
jgi:alkanesulfonate monooxygenase SsuD/methylene tetrahydromethanopterin reductase-like flavin-dependent oxidoreductase (luciferase family)